MTPIDVYILGTALRPDPKNYWLHDIIARRLIFLEQLFLVKQVESVIGDAATKSELKLATMPP